MENAAQLPEDTVITRSHCPLPFASIQDSCILFYLEESLLLPSSFFFKYSCSAKTTKQNVCDLESHSDRLNLGSHQSIVCIFSVSMPQINIFFIKSLPYTHLRNIHPSPLLECLTGESRIPADKCWAMYMVQRLQTWLRQSLGAGSCSWVICSLGNKWWRISALICPTRRLIF